MDTDKDDISADDSFQPFMESVKEITGSDYYSDDIPQLNPLLDVILGPCLKILLCFIMETSIVDVEDILDIVLTRPEIVERTGLPNATVYEKTEFLINKQLIEEFRPIRPQKYRLTGVAVSQLSALGDIVIGATSLVF